MQVNVTVPEMAANNSRGLLGNFNGNPDDDLETPDGDVLSPNATDKELFYDFGIKCK